MKNNAILFCKFLFITINLLICLPIFSLETIILDDSKGKYPVAPHLEYYEDTTRSLTINEISNTDKQIKFNINSKIAPVFRYNSSDYWVRFKIKNDSEVQRKWLLKIEYTWFQNIEFYIPDNEGSFLKKQTSYLFPVETRDIKSRKIVFNFILDHKQEKTYYMKLYSYNTINLQMTIYSYDAFLKEDHESQIIYGILYGILIIMIFYNLFLFFVLRDRSYLYYSFYVVFFTLQLSILHLHFYEYLPSFLNLRNDYTYYFIQGMMNITGILFTASFLMTKKNNPVIHKFVQANVIFNTLMIISCLFIEIKIMMHINNFLIFSDVFTALIAGIVSLYKGNRSARFYLLSWGVFLLGNIIAQILQLILADFSYYYYYFLMGSGVINVSLLSIALADRYRLIRLEKEKIEKINFEQTEFFVNLSHEIKTPLTLISNYLDEYLKKRELSYELKIIKQNIDKLLQDMISFFDVLKIQKGISIYYHDKIINLSDLLKIKTELFLSIASANKVTIIKNIENNIFLRIDPLALDRIINNILENAIKYNRLNGKINITLKSNNDKLELVVNDTGIGINKDQLDKIFQPYFQISHKKSNIQGIGMGLSIVKNIIDDINGEIIVDSKLNEGSSFKIILDKYTPKDNDIIYTQKQDIKPIISLSTPIDPCKDEESINKNNYNILVVEDNKELLYLIKEKMKDQYNVYCALDGVDALKKLENISAPDVIVSDIMMDKMDGYDFLNNVSNNERFKDIPFIFITAKSTMDEKLKGLKKGAIDFIFKPFVIDELVLKIESIIRYQKLKKDNFDKERFASLGMLLGGISHEIYNPLSGISGPLENLKKIIKETKLSDNEKTKKYFAYIENNILRIENIIKNLKILYSNKEFQKNKLDMDEIVTTLFNDFKDKNDKKINFINKVNNDIEIIGDREALYLVIKNLILNSINSISGYGEISISIEKEESGKVIKITDNGIGIKRKDINKIFTPFYTTRNEGTGLGLYIVKDLILKMGFDIIFNSIEGKGTAFTIIIKD